MTSGLSQEIVETLNNPPSIYQQHSYSPKPIYYIEPSTNKPFLIRFEKSRNQQSIYGIIKYDINANQYRNFAEITDTGFNRECEEEFNATFPDYLKRIVWNYYNQYQ